MKRILNLIIVDESGSMYVIWKQALAGMNETLQTIKMMQEKEPEVEQRVTLITFDSNHKRLIFDNAKPSETRTLTTKDYRPGGCTPLYDAIGMGISKVNAQASPEDKVLVTIITDGMENSSEEYTLSMINNLTAKLKKQGWTFALIGTDNLDVEGMAKGMGIANHLSFTEDEEGTKKMFDKELSSRERFLQAYSCNTVIPDGDYFVDDDLPY